MKRRWLGIIGGSKGKKSVDNIYEGVEEALKRKGIWLQNVYLGDIKGAPCNECNECLNDGICRNHDELADIIERVVEVEGVVLLSPAINYNLSSQMKIFIDRLVKVYKGDRDKLEKAFLLVSSDRGMESVGYSMEGMKNPLKNMGIDIVERIICTSTDRNSTFSLIEDRVRNNNKI